MYKLWNIDMDTTYFCLIGRHELQYTSKLSNNYSADYSMMAHSLLCLTSIGYKFLYLRHNKLYFIISLFVPLLRF